LRLANATDGLILLVVRYGEELSAVAQEYGSRLAGVIVNGLPKYRAEDVDGTLAADLESSGTRLLGSIPDDRRMLAPRIGQVAEFLGGEFLNGEDQSDRLLENFLIGGLVLDWGPFYFSSRKNTGVIVRGDRPDVQIAAIQTDTTRALVLTKGVRPVEYVVYEAEQRGIPLVVVPGNTHDVAEQLENLQPEVEFDHADKLAVETYLPIYEKLCGLNYSIIRLANVYGPRQDPHGEAGVVAIFAKAMLAGKPLTIFGDGNDERDYIYVQDVVDAIARAAVGTLPGPFNVGTGIGTSTNRIFEVVAQNCGHSEAAIHGPDRPGDINRISLDPSKAARELGWIPQVTLDDGLRTTVDWFKQQGE
jgi:hypothetical protein